MGFLDFVDGYFASSGHVINKNNIFVLHSHVSTPTPTLIFENNIHTNKLLKKKCIMESLK